jgi:protein gp37
MANKIGWCDQTWNPVTGCNKISPACDHCYAERMAKRLAGRGGYPSDDPFRVTFHADRLGQPSKWKKPKRIFVVSMGDLFHEDVPRSAIYQVFGAMHHCTRHTYILLTKRPAAMKEFLQWYASDPRRTWPLSNVWLGVTVEDQQRADERIPLLLRCPASVRFVSIEPMLGPVDLARIDFGGAGVQNVLDCRVSAWAQRNGIEKLNGIDWVIAGGETGPGARPAAPDWFRGIRDQCQEAGVPFFFKGGGDWSPHPGFPNSSTIADVPVGDGTHHRMFRVGKKNSGRMLDGREWNGMPAFDG